MSQARDLFASAGESGMALLKGLSACSILSLIGAFSSCPCGRVPNDRKRAPSTEVGMTRADTKEKTISAKVMKTSIGSASFISDLNRDHSTKHEIAHRVQRIPNHNQAVSLLFCVQGPDEAGIHYLHHHPP